MPKILLMIIFFAKQYQQAKLKQVGKNGILVVEDVKSMMEIGRFLENEVGYLYKISIK